MLLDEYIDRNILRERENYFSIDFYLILQLFIIFFDIQFHIVPIINAHNNIYIYIKYKNLFEKIFSTKEEK